MRAAQGGDADAFASLYDAHAKRVFALCVSLTSDRGMATELLQDTFVRVWERLSSFRGESSFTTWLHRVAVNVMLESDRSKRRRHLRVAIDADLKGEDGTQNSTSSSRQPDVALRLDIEHAMAQLPPGARMVFVLHDVEGFQHAEIAAQLGIAEGTSKAHLFRARRLLRGMLDR